MPIVVPWEWFSEVAEGLIETVVAGGRLRRRRASSPPAPVGDVALAEPKREGES